jgi:hypothetical protein
MRATPENAACRRFLRCYYLTEFWYDFVFAYAIYTVYFSLRGLTVFGGAARCRSRSAGGQANQASAPKHRSNGGRGSAKRERIEGKGRPGDGSEQGDRARHSVEACK